MKREVIPWCLQHKNTFLCFLLFTTFSLVLSCFCDVLNIIMEPWLSFVFMVFPSHFCAPWFRIFSYPLYPSDWFWDLEPEVLSWFWCWILISLWFDSKHLLWTQGLNLWGRCAFGLVNTDFLLVFIYRVLPKTLSSFCHTSHSTPATSIYTLYTPCVFICRCRHEAQ